MLINADHRGYTLIELIVALSIFTIVILIAGGAYLIMIGATRDSQAISTGINNLSYALETMTRNIRTGSQYDCLSVNLFKFTDINGVPTYYGTDGNKITVRNGDTEEVSNLTDTSVTISKLSFNCANSTAAGDTEQAHVTIVISGSVSAGPGRTESFNIETGATMRGPDL